MRKVLRSVIFVGPQALGRWFSDFGQIGKNHLGNTHRGNQFTFGSSLRHMLRDAEFFTQKNPLGSSLQTGSLYQKLCVFYGYKGLGCHTIHTVP